MKGYSSRLNAYARFCNQAGCPTAPAGAVEASNTLCAFMAYEHARGVKHTTVKAGLWAVRFYWGMVLDYDPAGRSRMPAILLKAYVAMDTTPDTYALPITPRMLEAALLGLHNDPVVAAAIIFGFIFFFRVGEYATTQKRNRELTTLRVGSVRVVLATAGATGTITVDLGKYKHAYDKQIIQLRRCAADTPWCPVKLLETYLATRKRNGADAPAFQWLDGSPLQSSQLNVLLRQLVERSGLAEPNSAFRYTSHGLRKGGAIAALSAGMASNDVLRDGRWSDFRSMEPYTRALPELGASDTMARILPGVFARA